MYSDFFFLPLTSVFLRFRNGKKKNYWFLLSCTHVTFLSRNEYVFSTFEFHKHTTAARLNVTETFVGVRCSRGLFITVGVNLKHPVDNFAPRGPTASTTLTAKRALAEAPKRSRTSVNHKKKKIKINWNRYSSLTLRRPLGRFRFYLKDPTCAHKNRYSPELRPLAVELPYYSTVAQTDARSSRLTRIKVTTSVLLCRLSTMFEYASTKDRVKFIPWLAFHVPIFDRPSLFTSTTSNSKSVRNPWLSNLMMLVRPLISTCAGTCVQVGRKNDKNELQARQALTS